MPIVDLSKKSWQWIALFTLAFVWGSSFILMKMGLRSFNYLQVAALRIFISFVVLIPLYPRAIQKINRNNFIHIIIAGYTGVFFPAFLFTKAQTEINSSLAGMINSLAPFFTLIMGVLFYKNKPARDQYIGIFLGLTGALGLISKGNLVDSFTDINYYALFVVTATVFYGINANEVRFKLNKFSGIEVTTLSFLFAGPPAGIYLLYSDFSLALSTPNWAVNLGYIAFLAIVGSVLMLFLFNSLVHSHSALFATSVTYIIPFFAIFWGFLDNERITIIQLLSMVLALIGIWLVNKKKKGK